LLIRAPFFVNDEPDVHRVIWLTNPVVAQRLYGVFYEEAVLASLADKPRGHVPVGLYVALRGLFQAVIPVDVY